MRHMPATAERSGHLTPWACVLVAMGILEGGNVKGEMYFAHSEQRTRSYSDCRTTAVSMMASADVIYCRTRRAAPTMGGERHCVGRSSALCASVR